MQLGEAWIVLRAITNKLHGDVKDGLDSAAKDVEAEGDKAGTSYGESFGKSAGKNIEDDFGQTLDNALHSSESDRVVNEDGKHKGESWLSGLKNVLSGSSSDVARSVDDVFSETKSKEDGDKKGKSWADGFLKGLKGGLAKGGSAFAAAVGPLVMGAGMAGLVGIAGGAIADLGAGLVALIGPLSQATTLLGVGFAAGIGALAQGAVIGSMFLKDLTASAKNVPPAAAAARQEFQAFSKSFKEMVATVGNQTVFPALQTLFHQLATQSMPLMKTAIQSTGQAFAGIINQLTGMLKNPIFSANLSTVFQTNATSIRNLGGAFLSIFQAMTSVLAVASPLINQFTGWIGVLAKHAAAAAESAQKTGTMSAYFSKAAEILKTLGSILSNVFGIFKDLASAAEPLGESILSSWQKGAKGLNDYLKSAEGVQALGDFFDPNGQVAANLRAVGDLLKPLLIDLAKLATNQGIAQLGRAILDILPGVTAVLDSAATAIGKVATAIGDAFTSDAGVAGIASLQKGVGALGDALAKIGPSIGPLLSIIGDLVTTLSNDLGPAIDTLGRVLPGLLQPIHDIADAIGNVLNTAIQIGLPLIQQLGEILGPLAEAFSGPLSTAIKAAGDILRVLFDILQPIGAVLQFLAPLIVAVGVAFLTWKAASVAGSAISDLGTKLSYAGNYSSVFGKAAAGAGTALSGLGAAVPFVAVAIAGVSMVFAQAKSDGEDLAAAFLKGGDAAEEASAKIAQLKPIADSSSGGLVGLGQKLGFFGLATVAAKTEVDTYNQSLKDHAANLTPVQAATEQLTRDTQAYNDAMKTGILPNSEKAQGLLQQVAGDQNSLNDATIQANIAAGNYASATSTLTANLYGELAAQQALSGSNTATTTAALNLARAQQGLSDTLKNSPKDALAVEAAHANIQQAINGTITAATDAAQKYADQAVKSGEFAKTEEGTSQAIAKGYQIQIAGLMSVADSLGKGPMRDAILGAVKQLETLSGIKADPKLSINTDQFNAGIEPPKKELNDLNKKVVKPTVGLTISPFKDMLGPVLGDVKILGDKKPTPTAYLNNDPFNAVFGTTLANSILLGQQKPTPVAGMNPTPFDAVFGDTMGNLAILGQQKPTPVATLIDNASAVANRIETALNALHDRTFTVTTYYNTVGQHVAGGAGNVGGTSTKATGGEVAANEWTTVGEHGRELLFLTRGQYVATYQQAQTILAAATLESQRQARAMASVGLSNSSLQASQITSNARQATASALDVPGPASYSDGSSRAHRDINMPIAVYPSAGMDEQSLARQVGIEVGYQLKRV